MITTNYFTTTDLGLASALINLNFQLLSLDKTNMQKVGFKFKHQPDIHVNVRMYWDNELKLNPRALFETQKMLKNRIYSGNE